MTGAVRLERVKSFDAVRDELGPLAERSGNVFATPEWLETWWKHSGAGRLWLTACRGEDDRLVALLALHRVRVGPLRLVRFIGHGPGDELGPVCAPADRARAAAALRQLLADERPDAFLGEQLRADVDWGLKASELGRIGSPVLRFDGATWDAYLASRSKHFRKGVRWRERRLLRDHDAAFRLGEPDQLEADLDSLFSLHALRFREVGSAFERNRAFHAEFAALARDRGWLRLWFLDVGGRPVAAWYGFRFGGAECFYQSGRDPAWERLSVGSVLLVHTIRAAREDGIEEYRFLRGDEDYKDQFATEDAGLVTLSVAPGLRGAIALKLGVRLRLSGC